MACLRLERVGEKGFLSGRKEGYLTSSEKGCRFHPRGWQPAMQKGAAD
jgi:hypothetical protein